MRESDERRARNEAVFREANEGIREAQRRLDLPDERAPFLCECDDESCRTVIRLTPAEYERVRAAPTRFVIADGHDVGERAGRVEEGDGYSVIEKRAAGGEVARATDPRADER